ncbi:MucR family transcriptional regulator [Methylobacterium soli]|uniref:MucR family transcriptional regulator n=1 Tax=Methylobacterium soli TaxID=553447 RepID=A0A6L3T6E6_9HYPH|nr:MucR family transcriptional regulator [Methylobacterium soli]KAB1080951.1 MucR family transcriptional regulator [Methylobacterium soli]GJE45141.1 Transcriptional regulatory protein ros [Methylobacterium soli]
MSEATQDHTNDFVTLTADIVCAYVSNNSVPIVEVASLLGSVHKALSGLAAGPVPAASAAEVDKPTAAQIRKSITAGALISFIDGKPYKTLKRHLSAHNLDPHSYRQRYGLSKEYPMVCPSYSEQRAELARAIGLGRPGAQASAVEPKSRAQRKTG